MSGKDKQLIWEEYKRQFEVSISDPEDVIRGVVYDIDQQGEHHEGTWDTIRRRIQDAALEGVDLVDMGYATRRAEKQGAFSNNAAETIINIINTTEQEIDQIESEYEG